MQTPRFRWGVCCRKHEIFGCLWSFFCMVAYRRLRNWNNISNIQTTVLSIGRFLILLECVICLSFCFILPQKMAHIIYQQKKNQIRKGSGEQIEKMKNKSTRQCAWDSRLKCKFHVYGLSVRSMSLQGFRRFECFESCFDWKKKITTTQKGQDTQQDHT